MTADTTPLPGQYFISERDGGGTTGGFERERVGRWTIVYDSEFRAAPVVAGGEAIGAVVGTFLDVDDGGETGSVDLGEPPLQETAGAIERTLSRLVGRYIGLLDGDGGPCVFTDQAGALPAVYDDGREFVAASPLSIPVVSHRDRFRERLFGELGQRGSSWLPGTTTYYRGVARLLPNHFLDLDTWTTERYRPDEPADRATSPGPAAIAGEIADELSAVFGSVVDRYDVPKLGLTAGVDSRVLLAVARRWATDGTVSLYTYGGERFVNDVHVARRIASKHDLVWEPIAVKEATERQRERFRRRTGYTVGTATKAIHPTIRAVGGDARILGMGGEIGRGYYWRVPDDERTELDAVELLDRFQRPAHPDLVEDVGEWLLEVDGFDTFTTLDLAYQEHRLGCWGGPQHLGVPTDSDVILPYAFLPVVEAMQGPPPRARRFDALPRAVIDRTWRELNEFPFNAFSGWSRWRNLQRRANMVRVGLANPGYTMRYVSRRYLS